MRILLSSLFVLFFNGSLALGADQQGLQMLFKAGNLNHSEGLRMLSAVGVKADNGAHQAQPGGSDWPSLEGFFPESEPTKTTQAQPGGSDWPSLEGFFPESEPTDILEPCVRPQIKEEQAQRRNLHLKNAGIVGLASVAFAGAAVAGYKYFANKPKADETPDDDLIVMPDEVVDLVPVAL